MGQVSGRVAEDAPPRADLQRVRPADFARWLSSLQVPKSEWGPIAWEYLHLRAIQWSGASTQEQAEAERQVLLRIFGSLPCPQCRVHASRYLQDNPPDLRTSENYQVWMFSFHNAVSERLNADLARQFETGAISYKEWLRRRKPVIAYAEYQDLYREQLLRKQMC